MGDPTTSRGRNVVVYACCSGGSVLSSVRLAAFVQSFERPVSCTCLLFFGSISLFTFRFYLETTSKTLMKTNLFRFSFSVFDSVWTRRHAQGEGSQNSDFPEQANCSRVMVSQRTGGKGCLYRHTSSPGLTPTFRCRVDDKVRHLHVWCGCLAENVDADNMFSR